jgi:kynurenine formamidase
MARIVDLTLPLRGGMRGVEIEKRHTVEVDGWNTRTLHLYSHCGTHMDAPLHFAAGNGTIDRIPLSRCLRPAWVVDLAGIEPRTLITLDQLGPIARRVQPGECLLLKTLWSRYAEQPEMYRDGLPRLSEELARWCVQRRVGLVGVEPPSVADVHNREEITLIHRTLLAGDVIIVEGLANLDQLQEERVLFGAMPLKIDGGDGSPCRAFALEGMPPVDLGDGLT